MQGLDPFICKEVTTAMDNAEKEEESLWPKLNSWVWIYKKNWEKTIIKQLLYLIPQALDQAILFIEFTTI